MVEIIPAIMPRNLYDLRTRLEPVAPYAKVIQIDVMDGKFVPARTWPYGKGRESFEPLLEEEDGLPYWETLDYEIDLMVSEPEEAIEEWISAGAARVIVHIESASRLKKIVDDFRARFPFPPAGEKKDVELVLALGLNTPTDSLLPFLEDIDGVQFMGIEKIGYQGEMLSERLMPKIHDFHNAHPEVIIAVDGGVNLENAKALVEAGAKRLVSGSVIFENSNPGGVIKQFKSLVF
jgi:ribulose-phosphate 3-epimerase